MRMSIPTTKALSLGDKAGLHAVIHEGVPWETDRDGDRKLKSTSMFSPKGAQRCAIAFRESFPQPRSLERTVKRPKVTVRLRQSAFSRRPPGEGRFGLSEKHSQVPNRVGGGLKVMESLCSSPGSLGEAGPPGPLSGIDRFPWPGLTPAHTDRPIGVPPLRDG